jgi:hypothetical protein
LERPHLPEGSHSNPPAEDLGSIGQGKKNMASTLELAIVYVRVLQKRLGRRARLEVAEKLMKGNSSSSQTSD